MASVTGGDVRDALNKHAGMENALGESGLGDKCAVLCDKYKLGVEAFVLCLEAFLVEASKHSITLEDMSKLEQRLYKQSASAKQQLLRQQQLQQQQQQDQRRQRALKPVDNLLSVDSPVVASSMGKRSLPPQAPSATVTPFNGEDGRPTKFQSSSNGGVPSSFHQLPALDSQTPGGSSSGSGGGEAFRTRKGRGDSVASMNTSLGSRADFVRSDRGPLGMRCAISTSGEDINNCEGRYRYMFTTLEERARNLDRQLLKMQTFMCDKANLKAEDLQPVGVPSPDVVWVCGRICCEAETGKMNNQSVMLEGSRRDSGGRRVKLDLTEVQTYSLFPGQIVLAEGINSGGRKMVVKRLVEGYPADQPKTVPQKLLEFHHSTLYQGGEPVNVCVAAGPFTTSDTLSYEPLRELLGTVAAKKPDVLILIGPFVDVSQPLLSSGNVELEEYDEEDRVVGSHGASYEMVFIERIVRDGLATLFSADDSIPTNIILVPSLFDAHHECVFPQPPFGDRDEVKTDYFQDSLGVLNIPHCDPNDSAHRRVHLMSNPCMFRVNEVVFGVTSLDVLFALSSDEISQNVPGHRLDRLVAHMLQQHSFCPQFPMPQSTLSQVRVLIACLGCIIVISSLTHSLPVFSLVAADGLASRGQVADAGVPRCSHSPLQTVAHVARSLGHHRRQPRQPHERHQRRHLWRNRDPPCQGGRAACITPCRRQGRSASLVRTPHFGQHHEDLSEPESKVVRNKRRQEIVSFLCILVKSKNRQRITNNTFSPFSS